MCLKSLEKKKDLVPFLLRIGLGIIFFWFGITKFTNVQDWLRYIPPWLQSLIPISMNLFLYIQGAIETLIGLFLILGIFVRKSAFLAALILIVIIITVGFNDISLRDFGLLMIAISLMILGQGKYSISKK
ncbi:DoxX family protein [Candidatus Woesearchaeota archaeon]|nr:DoxX family protein [Candidatus Woesearchaeota archaeon]